VYGTYPHLWPCLRLGRQALRPVREGGRGRGWGRILKGVPSAESSRPVRGLGKGVSGKPYPRLCNARRPRLESGTFRSQCEDLVHNIPEKIVI